MKNIVIIFLIFTSLFAQSNQEFMLKDVNVEGNVVSTANTIIFTSGLRKGAKISSAEFPRAIKRLWQLGLFDDVQIKYDEEAGNEVNRVAWSKAGRERILERFTANHQAEGLARSLATMGVDVETTELEMLPGLDPA